MENWYFHRGLIQQVIGEQVGPEYCLALDHIAKDLLLREGHKKKFGRVSGYPDPIGKGEEIFRDLYYRLGYEQAPRNEMFNIAFELKEDYDKSAYILSCYTADNSDLLWREELNKDSIDYDFTRF